MKIKDVIADWFIGTNLFEMAFERKSVIDKISNLQLQIARHLIKHIYYDVPLTTKKHWGAELNNWLTDIDEYRLKGNKTLDASVYYKLLFTEPLGERSDVIRKIKKINTDKDMERMQGNMVVAELHENLEKILHAVSYDLSNDELKDVSAYLEGIY